MSTRKKLITEWSRKHGSRPYRVHPSGVSEETLLKDRLRDAEDALKSARRQFIMKVHDAIGRYSECSTWDAAVDAYLRAHEDAKDEG